MTGFESDWEGFFKLSLQQTAQNAEAVNGDVEHTGKDKVHQQKVDYINDDNDGPRSLFHKAH